MANMTLLNLLQDAKNRLEDFIGTDCECDNTHAQNGTTCCLCQYQAAIDNELSKVDDKWSDTPLQAIRLVSEILATQDTLDMETLCESMDLEMDDLQELMDRIQQEWEDQKEIL